MCNAKKVKSRRVSALIIAACGLFYLLSSIVRIHHNELSVGMSLFAKVALVLEILLVLFLGIATWMEEIPLVPGLLLVSLLAVDALVSITHCSTLLYVNVVLSTCLVLYSLYLYLCEARASDSNPK
jgi:hypothetical protein